MALDEGSDDDGRVGLYLIKCHGFGDERDKARLLCKVCEWGRLDMVKELVEQHNVDPNGEFITHVTVQITQKFNLSCEFFRAYTASPRECSYNTYVGAPVSTSACSSSCAKILRYSCEFECKARSKQARARAFV